MTPSLSNEKQPACPPCPFCKVGLGVLLSTGDAPRHAKVWIQCAKCGAQGPRFPHYPANGTILGRELAWEAWGQSSKNAEIADLEQRLEAALILVQDQPASPLSSNAAGVQDTDTDLRKQEAISDHCARPTDGALEPFYCTHCRTQPHDLASNIRCIREEGRVSPSLLQRRFRYGYGHAMEVIAELVKRGVVIDEQNGKFHLSSHVTKSGSASGFPKSVSGSTVAAPAAVPDSLRVAAEDALVVLATLKITDEDWPYGEISPDLRRHLRKAHDKLLTALSSHGGQPESADGSGDKGGVI